MMKITPQGVFDKFCVGKDNLKRNLDINFQCPVKSVEKDPRWVFVRPKREPTPSAISRHEFWTAPPYQFAKRTYATKTPDGSEKRAGLKELRRGVLAFTTIVGTAVGIVVATAVGIIPAPFFLLLVRLLLFGLFFLLGLVVGPITIIGLLRSLDVCR